MYRDSCIGNGPTSTPLYLAGARGRHSVAPGLVDGPISMTQMWRLGTETETHRQARVCHDIRTLVVVQVLANRNIHATIEAKGAAPIMYAITTHSLSFCVIELGPSTRPGARRCQTPSHCVYLLVEHGATWSDYFVVVRSAPGLTNKLPSRKTYC